MRKPKLKEMAQVLEYFLKRDKGEKDFNPLTIVEMRMVAQKMIELVSTPPASGSKGEAGE